MKKLMFTMAAIAAGIAVADIQSSNIVGYANGAARDGIKVIAPQFANITDGDTYKLNDLIPQGPNVYGKMFLTRINKNGGVLTQYMWTDEGGDSWDVADVWVDQDNKIATDVKLQRGEALWMQASASDQSLQSAGQVETKDLECTLRDGIIVIGNAYPTPVKLNDIYPTGPSIYGKVFVTRINKNGGVLAQYMWTDEGGDGWDVADVWVDQDNKIVGDDIVLESGEGLWVQASSSEQKLFIPAPEL